MYRYLAALPSSAMILVSLGIILLAGFLLTRITTRIRLPHVSGYIIAGILIGPCVLDLVPPSILANTDFISDIALAFIAFGVGQFFKKQVLKTVGAKIIIITLFESLAAGVIVTISMYYLFHLSFQFSLMLGAVSTATAPASTMMTIRQYQAKGDFVNTLLMVVALDDVVCLLVFSVVTSVISAGAQEGGSAAETILLPLLYNAGALLLGWLFGVLLSKLLSFKRCQDHALILLLTVIFFITGLCAMVDVSPLLSCMLLGTTYINLTNDDHLFDTANGFTSPIMALFFVRSGMNLDLSALKTFGLIGVAYFLIRIVGKYLGSFVGCAVVKTAPPIRNFLGLALVPQAGVAIGLAFLGQRMLPAEAGEFLVTIILASSVLYELIGPACAKLSLVLSGVIRSGAHRDEAVSEEALMAEKELLWSLLDQT